MQFWDYVEKIASILVSSTKKTEFSAVDILNCLKVKCVSLTDVSPLIMLVFAC
ncbi:hypothetical protein NIES4075_21010 [Tolypothrix sp. NIES-4075]|nr:hypothetical protein NIES4075_21010 [Tolypothrix sp. NIES-4075]